MTYELFLTLAAFFAALYGIFLLVRSIARSFPLHWILAGIAVLLPTTPGEDLLLDKIFTVSVMLGLAWLSYRANRKHKERFHLTEHTCEPPPPAPWQQPTAFNG